MTMLLIIASLGLNGLVGISAHPVADLQACRTIGSEAIAKLSQSAGAVGSGPASFACFDTTGKTGVLSVVAYVTAGDNTIKIGDAVKPTGEACAELGKKALATKIVPGPMSWSCFDMSKF
jgi:hypothetical protein